MRTTRETVQLAAAMVLSLGILTGCGDDDGDADAGSDTGGGDNGTSCSTAVTATFPDGSEVALGETAALDVGSGAAYTVYAADFEVAAERVSGAVPEEGGNMATLALTTFNAEVTPEQVEEGATIAWTSEFGVLTFSVVFNQGTVAVGNTAGAAGTVMVLSLDDDSICLHVDYSDDEKSLVGTIAADIV